MSLKNLMVSTKDAWIDYPGLEGFSVHVVNLGREKIVALRKSCLEIKFDRKTKLQIEELNEKKFIAEFSAATIKNWKGLKYKYLEDLMLADISTVNEEEELPFSVEDAEILLSNSGDFDRWLNDAVFDLENFRSGGGKTTVAKAGAVSK
jgi:hypothetical protein